MAAERSAPAARHVVVPAPRGTSAEPGLRGAPAEPAPESAPWQDAIRRTMWELIDIPLMIVDAGHRVVMVNRAGQARLKVYGSGVGDEVPIPEGRIFQPDRVTPLSRADHPIGRALRGEVVTGQELLVLEGGDTVVLRVSMSAYPVPLEDGPGVLCAWQDVTHARRVEEEHRIAITRLTMMLDGAQDYAILLLDPEGCVVTWSASAARVTGYETNEIVGRSYGTFFVQAEREAGVPQRVLAAAAAKGRVDTDGLRVRQDGSTFWARGVVTALRDDDDQLIGFVKVTHDVTRQREDQLAVVRLNQELTELNADLERRVAERTELLERQAADLSAANRELEAFSYSVSHDLRAPLRAMNGFARILLDDHGDELSAEGRVYLGKIQDNARQMGNLIDALLSFSRMQRQDLHTQVVDTAGLVHRCWADLAVARGGRDIEFVVGDLPESHGDPRLLEHVWSNLLDNAIKYTGPVERPRIEVGGVVHDDIPCFSVRDNGAGFDMRYAGKLFQVFQRLHRVDEFPGTGIGLALVQRIVHRHGGRVWAEGIPGGGATFTFSLWERS